MNIIVPVDFSPTAMNAAEFAARMLNGQKEATLILYHVYDDQENEQQVSGQLRAMKDKLLDETVIHVEWMAEYSYNFIDSLERKVRHLDAALVVMGVTEKSRLEQVVAGSNSLDMIDRNLCPVLVIPPAARYNAIRNIALASDFKDVTNTIPVVPVKKVLNLFGANLHIVNINNEIYVSLSREYLEQRQALMKMFSDYKPEFYFITTYDFHETLRQFIVDKKIDLVLTFPRKHSFINNLIKGNNTKKLVFESAVPVLAAHE